MCGCGDATPIAKKTITRLGHVKGEHLRFAANHSLRWQRDHSPEATKTRLFTRRRIDARTGCWIWTGPVLNGPGGGYGLVWLHGKRVRVHRLAAHLWNGFDLKSDKLVLHSCDVKLCFNPEHLRAGTQLENMQDRIERGRAANGRRRLFSDDQVRRMRAARAAGLSVSEIAAGAGESALCVWRAVTGKTYAHV